MEGIGIAFPWLGITLRMVPSKVYSMNRVIGTTSTILSSNLCWHYARNVTYILFIICKVCSAIHSIFQMRKLYLDDIP
jgi:hypothetical protein